jgi:proton-dependent oligopeptide transporter, POT family
LFKNYPQGYSTVFWTKFWGNFSFYGLKSILILYLVNQFLLTDKKAFELYGVFMAFAYLTPVLGGWLADQVLGARHSVLVGSALIFVACIMLSIPNETLCLLGLSLLCVGTGLFKPTTISAVGHLFSKKEHHLQDSAYTTFYLGMSLGTFTATSVCGWLGQSLGWGQVFPFLAAGIAFGGWLFHRGLHKHKNFHAPQSSTPTKKLVTWVGILCSLPLFYLALSQASSMQWILPGVLLGSIGCLIWIFFQSTASERRKVLEIGLLMILFSIFCSLIEQTGSSVTLFIERSVDREILNGIILPTPFFQSILPASIIPLSPLFATLWRKIAEQGKDPSVFTKFTLGFLFVSINYWIFVFATEQALRTDSLVSLWWIVLGFVIHVMGDLCIIPIGFAAVSKLAPKRFANMLMGLWMASIAFGHYAASLLAKLSSVPCLEEEMTLLSAIEIYQLFFKRMGIIALIAPLGITLSIITVKYLMRKKSKT